MLQRIQTIWLLLAGISVLLTLKLPYATVAAAANQQYLELTGLNSGVLVIAATIIVATLAFITIGMFKNRKQQLGLCIAGIVIEMALIFACFNYVSSYSSHNPSFYSILHLAVIAFFVLAARGINKDEKLVKDSDRLR